MHAFKGVWIPAHIWKNKELSWTEKLLLVELDSRSDNEPIDVNYASLAKKFALEDNQLDAAIKSLCAQGFCDLSEGESGEALITTRLTPRLSLDQDEMPLLDAKKNAVAELREKAKEVLAYLNEATGRDFRDTDTNIEAICPRLKELGVTVEGVKRMIDRQSAKWIGTEFEEYLRPSTLFRASKFDGYYTARELPIRTSKGRSGS
jgi:uncharacterized phage protein (TIGR02220 family)